MKPIDRKVKTFLSLDRIAVAGITHTQESVANNIYHRLKNSGHTVFPVNPHMDTFEGKPCFPDVKTIPHGVEGVVIVTRPEITEKIVSQCAEAGVHMVWMHRSLGFMGEGSVSETAVEFCKENGIEVIAGACPMMFCEPVDFGHKCFRWILRISGKMPD
ncbi:MAG: CoA-binding protein [bacterium]